MVAEGDCEAFVNGEGTREEETLYSDGSEERFQLDHMDMDMKETELEGTADNEEAQDLDALALGYTAEVFSILCFPRQCHMGIL